MRDRSDQQHYFSMTQTQVSTGRRVESVRAGVEAREGLVLSVGGLRVAVRAITWPAEAWPSGGWGIVRIPDLAAWTSA